MLQSLRITSLLCRLKLRLLFNSLKNWASAGKTIGIGLSVILTAVIITSGASDAINAMRMLPYAELLLDWLLGGIIIYVIFVVFTGDLITGHTLNTGQMSSDFGYLQTLPLTPLNLIMVKLFERVISDYLGLIILFSAFLGIACRDGVTLWNLLLALILYLEISLLIGLLINICMICLTRFFRTTTINNLFSLLGYGSAFLSIAPYLILSNFLPEVLDLIINNLDILNETVFVYLLPMQWLAVSLLSAAFCDEFFYFTAFWAVCMLAGSLVFHVTIKLNWFNFSHGNTRKTDYSGHRWFRGLYHKEVMLLKSDFNLLVNALLMPITLIILEIYFLKDVFKITTPSVILNIIAGAVIYFSMFGPVNATGYEGRAISLLETLPLSPHSLLRQKSIFWTIIAEAIFVPAVIVSMLHMGFAGATIFKAALSTTLFTIGCVWVAISVSAIFPCFESKVLQQRSTFAGKLAALAMMLLLVPVKDLSPLNFYSLGLFLCLGTLIAGKAVNHLFFRLDHEAQASSGQRLVNTLILFLAMAGCEVSLTQCFSAVAPGVDTGIWNWVISAAIFLPANALLLLVHRAQQKSASTSAAPSAPTGLNAAWWLALTLTGILLFLSYRLHLARPETTAIFQSSVLQIVELAKVMGLPTAVWQVVMALLASLLGGLAAFNALSCLSGCHQKTLSRNVAVFAALLLAAPQALLPVALLAVCGLAALRQTSSNNWPGTALAATLSAAQAIFFIFF
ncbi:MAG TPA: hypothetical protein PLM07_00500 [Candidatus Rifleibacterium sp.]|nr:hypothetical protein [Candidatus Rifleibacterium sp.]HPT44359.1 hypothetical protein [Candidatus Rifleibacterium sp.]